MSGASAHGHRQDYGGRSFRRSGAGRGAYRPDFYLTARTTVKSVAGGAGAHHERRDALRAVTLTAKEKCCPEPGTACHPAYCARAAGFFDRLADALSETQAAGHWGRQEIDALAQRHGLCPFELSLAVAQRCDVVVCDYNCSIRACICAGFEEPGQGMLLVDEAHNLVDRARDVFSAELTRASVLALTRTLRGKRAGTPVRALKKAAGAKSRTARAVSRSRAATRRRYRARRATARSYRSGPELCEAPSR